MGGASSDLAASARSTSSTVTKVEGRCGKFKAGWSSRIGAVGSGSMSGIGTATMHQSGAGATTAAAKRNAVSR
jgi:hypothetical protein